jgi:site-specific DNA recombinase
MEPADHAGDIVRLTVEAHLQRVGREIKLVVHDAEHRAEADPGLLRIIARAHDFRERGIRNPDLTVTAIAGQERLTIGYLSRLLRALSDKPERACKWYWSEAFRPPADATRLGLQNGSV